ncbi:7908_t:CDS:2 [Entrophospora sp. SA101]|nr:7908_t:CDS:2 [Entrophospora sp. SA101]
MQYKDAKSKPLDMLGDKYPMSYTRFYQIWKGEEVCTNTWKLSLADSENDITKPVVVGKTKKRSKFKSVRISDPPSDSKDLTEKIGGDSQSSVVSTTDLAQQILNFLMIICSALMLWKTLSLYTNSESPIVVVLSGSMEPAFFRGDLLFLTMPKEPVKVGDIVVFKIQGREVPIVHRVIKLHNKAQSDKQYILTKGDNNQVDDRGLYNKNQFWIHKEHLVGKVTGFLPYVGMITIVMNDYPQLKYLLIGALAIYMLINRE